MELKEFTKKVMEDYSISGELDNCIDYIYSKVRELSKSGSCIAVDDETVKEIIINFDEKEWANAQKKEEEKEDEEIAKIPTVKAVKPKKKEETAKGEQLCLF